MLVNVSAKLSHSLNNFGSSSKTKTKPVQNRSESLCRSAGTVPDILGLVWLSFRPKSDSKSKISGGSFKGPCSSAEPPEVEASPIRIKPKSGPEARFPARKHYCVTQGRSGILETDQVIAFVWPPFPTMAPARRMKQSTRQGLKNFKIPAGNLRFRIGFGPKAAPNQAQNTRYGTHRPAHKDSERFWPLF